MNNNNNIPTTARDNVLNNMEGALLNLPKKSRFQYKEYKNWIAQYENKTHSRIEDISESDLEANAPWIIKNYARNNNLKKVIVYLKHLEVK